MSLPRFAVGAASFAAVVVAGLCLIPAGRRAAAVQVRPVVSMYGEASAWADDPEALTPCDRGDCPPVVVPDFVYR